MRRVVFAAALAWGCAASSAQDAVNSSHAPGNARDASLDAAAATHDAASELEDAGGSATLADFSDGDWVLRVDRELVRDAGISNPPEELSEQDYQPTTTPRSHSVRVDLDGNQVLIDDATWAGGRVAMNEDTKIEFYITVGTFAGGRFVVWQGSNGLQAEFTLYGSGVPIAQSERGALSRTAP